MKKNYLKLLVIISIIIGTSFSVKAIDLDKEYHKNAFIIGAYFSSAKKDMFCLGKNASAQLSPTDGRSNAWYFNKVVGSDGNLVGYVITQDAPKNDGQASTFFGFNKGDSNRFGFENFLPDESFPREYIFAFEKQNSISGVEVYKIKNLGTKKYVKGSFNVGGYTGTISASDASSATLWTLNAVDLDPKTYYSKPALSGENSISSFTFKLVNSSDGTALSTSKADAYSMGGGYKVKMSEVNDTINEQLWHFIPVKGYSGYYFLRNMGNGLYFAGLNSAKRTQNYSESYPKRMLYIASNDDSQDIQIHYYEFGEKKYLQTGNEKNTLQLIRFDQ